MRYKTEMMEAILTNKKSQRIIDYVSQLYGASYVGLWIFQAIGTVLEDVCEIAEQLRHETNAATTSILLDYWERHYEIPINRKLTDSQRQANLIAKIQTRGPINPTRLESYVSAALGGVEVDIVENTAKNTFLVIIRESVSSLEPAYKVLDRRKPAHLIYGIVVTIEHMAETKVSIGTTVTHSEHFEMEVIPVREFPPEDTKIITAVAQTYKESVHLEVTE